MMLRIYGWLRWYRTELHMLCLHQWYWLKNARWQAKWLPVTDFIWAGTAGFIYMLYGIVFQPYRPFVFKPGYVNFIHTFMQKPGMKLGRDIKYNG